MRQKKAAKPSGEIRIQFLVGSRSAQRLTRLMDETEAISYAEVAKNALRLYDAWLAEETRGAQFVVRKIEGEITPFTLPPQADEKPTSNERVQFAIGPRSAQRLTRLMDDTEAETSAEVVRKALRLYDAWLQEHKNGHQIMLRKVDGELSPFAFVQ